MPKKGKKGTEQRVKGNVKSASSGRMSELLGSEAMGFIGFDTISTGFHGNSTDSTDGGGRVEDLLVAGAGSSFHSVMKQLGKRDPTTKLRALQEFSSLCEQEETHNILAVLHVWALMYNKLSTDSDHRVREASHKALRSCAACLKSGLAPQLRSIIACWVGGMCDPHAPAATAARLAFDAAFTSKKQREVLEFGFKAVIKHTEDMILKETPDTFSDPKIYPADERQQRYERALVMAVQGMTLALRGISPEHLTKAVEVYQSLLGEKRVWKLARYGNPGVRASVFSLVTVLCERAPSFVVDHMKLICSTVLGSLGEDNPVVIGSLWEACLTLITKTENWSDHVNVHKALLPGLWSFLKSGGHGSAKITYPCLLPLLSILANKVFSDDADFARLFLERLGSGLRGDRVRVSHTESEVVMSTFAECALFLVRQFKPLEGEGKLCPLLSLLKDLMVYSLSRSCPSAQSEVIAASLAGLLVSLLGACSDHPLSSALDVLRDEFSVVLTACLAESADRKTLIERLESLLSNFHSPPKAKKAKRGCVRFSDPSPEDSDITGYHVISTIEQADDHVTNPLTSEDERWVILRSWVSPVMLCLCGECIVKVCQWEGLSQLLLKLLKLYSADSAFSSQLLSSMKDAYPELLTKHFEDTLPSDLVVIPTLLLQLARLDTLSAQNSKFISNMLECVLVLVTRSFDITDDVTDDVIVSPGWKLLTKLIQLEELGAGRAAVLLLGSSHHLLTGLFSASDSRSVYLWPFLEGLFTTQPEEPLSSKMFSITCQQLCEIVSTNLKFTNIQMLKVLTKVQDTTVQSQLTDCTTLLECLLKWALFDPDLESSSLLEDVIAVYHHLLACFHDNTTYLTGCPQMVTMAMEEDQQNQSNHNLLIKHLQSARVYSALHRNVMSHDTYNLLYGPLSKLPQNLESQFFPLPSFEYFCREELIFSPLSVDLRPPALVTTLPPSLFPLLYTAVLLGNSSFDDFHADSQLQRLSRLWGQLGGGEAVESVMCEGIEWVELVLALSLTASYLAESQLTNKTPLESKIAELFQSAVKGCVILAADHAPQQLSLLTKVLVERVGTHGSPWLPVIQSIFTTLGSLCEERETLSIEELTSVLYYEPKGQAIYSALKPFKCNHYQQQLEQLVSRVPNDPCLLVGCWKLLPGNEVLSSLGSKVITEIAEKQGHSELNLFESLMESANDPLAYSILALTSLLLTQGNEPSSVAMDFVLCSCVSLLELLNEAGPTPTLNEALFSCQLLSTLLQLSHHLNSAHASGEVVREWREFFQPSVQAQLLPLFLRQSGGVESPSLVYRSLAVCTVVCEVCSSPEGVGLETLVDIILSGPTHAKQLTAFVLAQRLIESLRVESDDDEPLTAPSGNSIRFSELKALFSECFERINIDLVFFEDSQEQRSKVGSTHTTAYLLTWLLVVTAMSHCSPECRGALSEWLKELSLFPHLLHGLLSLLPDTLRASIDPKPKVTLTPDHQQLALVVYVAVAKQLPCMLRGWFLTLDRQTSAQVAMYVRASRYLKSSIIVQKKRKTLSPSIEDIHDCTTVTVRTFTHNFSNIDLQSQKHLLSNNNRYRFTTKHVSPGLHDAELSSIRQVPPTHGNMEIRAYSRVSEVSVVYHVDEFSIELFLRLPETYPLQPPTIREGKRVRVEQAQWRKWLLQLNIFVTNQNGSLLDGLLLWKSNLDKHFSGVEDCMICFSVIHSSNHSLPKMVCKTCKKKFHSACLYKWFNTSNKSSCPLCRNIF